MGDFDCESSIASVLSCTDPKEYGSLFDDMMNRYCVALQDRIQWVNDKMKKMPYIEDASPLILKMTNLEWIVMKATPRPNR